MSLSAASLAIVAEAAGVLCCWAAAPAAKCLAKVSPACQPSIRFRKERDFHRMHHKRVVQEKNRLITDIKRLKVCVGM